MILDAATKTLEVVLNAAPVSAQWPYVVNWTNLQVKAPSPNYNQTGVQSSDGATNGVTPVTVVPAPAPPILTRVDWLSLQNADLVANTVAVQLNHTGTRRTLWKGALNPGDTLMYVYGRGFYVLDSNGEVKASAASATGAGGSSSAVIAALFPLQPLSGPGSTMDWQVQVEAVLVDVLVELRLMTALLADAIGGDPDELRRDLLASFAETESRT